MTGCMAFSMFVVAAAVQFAASNLNTRWVFTIAALATVLAMGCVWTALQVGSALWLIASALLAGTGQGLGQLGGLTLIADHVPAQRRAQANAVFNMGGYVPAGAIPVITGYLIDYRGLSVGIASLSLIIASLASMALVQLQRKHRDLCVTGMA